MKQVAVGWFEIPATNMERAMAFYENVFDCKLDRHQMDEIDMAWFPWNHTQGGAGGSLVKNEKYYKPSTDGVLVYFSSADVAIELEKIVSAGGKLLQRKTLISEEIGYMGLFLDTEGNRIGIHSLK